MTLKNEFELARYMGTSLKAHANKVENGQVDPYRPFLTGAETVTISIRLTEPTGIIVTAGKNVESFEAEIKALQKTVKEQAATIQSLNLEHETAWTPEPVADTITPSDREEVVAPKPKRTSK